MTMTLGLIGSGMIGSTVARLAVAAGLDVALSNSRGPETLSDLVADLGPRARAATPDEVAGQSDLVVATVPLSAYRRLSAAALAGKTVIDTMNYYPERDGRFAELDSAALTQSELVQQHLADSRVVKAFNNISFFSLLNLARERGAPDRSALPIAGNDDQARAEVATLLDTLGYDCVDLGPLSESWRCEPETPVYVQPYMPTAVMPEGMAQEAALRWLHETPNSTVPASRVAQLVAEAIRNPGGGRMPT